MRKKRSGARRHVDSTAADITEIVDASRRVAARSVNAVITATYWAIGRRIAEQERRGGERVPLPEARLAAIAGELQARFGRAYSVRALRTMRTFHAAYAHLRAGVCALEQPVVLAYSDELRAIAAAFSLSWSHYVQLIKVNDPNARNFYECEALRHGWTVRQLAQQIRAGLYERVRPPRGVAAVRRALAAVPPPPMQPDELLRDRHLRGFFQVPRPVAGPMPDDAPRDGSSRARDGYDGWLARARDARRGDAPSSHWLQ